MEGESGSEDCGPRWVCSEETVSVSPDPLKSQRTYPDPSDLSRPSERPRNPQPPDHLGEDAPSLDWPRTAALRDGDQIWREGVKRVKVRVGGEHEDIDSDGGVQGRQDVGLTVQYAARKKGVSGRTSEQPSPRGPHRGMENRSSWMKASFHVRTRVPAFGGGNKPFRQTYSVLARTTGCEMRSSASTNGADERVRSRSRAVGWH